MLLRRPRQRRNIEAASKYLRWMIDAVSVDDGLTIRGWALRGNADPACATFLLNGVPFEEVHYPLQSPDVERVFWCDPSAASARFVCRSVRLWHDLFAGRRATLEYLPLGGGGRDEIVDHTAWFLGDPMLDRSAPGGANVSRVIGTAAIDKYFLGGATAHGRLERYLLQRFGRGFSGFRRILDWGCGAARLTRYLPASTETEVWGADIDAVNLAWCRTSIPGVRFEQIPLSPPTGLPDAAFDLILGISVFTHLKEHIQERWLAELARVATPGAVLLVSVSGPSAMALDRVPERVLRRLEKVGFLMTGENSQIDAKDAEGHYYVNVLHTREYLHREWGRHFEILEFVDALAAYQDIVVLRRR